MKIHFPERLQQLLADGVWATAGADVDQRIPADLARQWAPDSPGIHLAAVPSLLADDIVAVPELEELWNLTDVDPNKCVVIADFGLGSDNPIILDFDSKPAAVRTQQWQDGDATRPTWVTIAPTFDAFADMLGLD